jgi:hypothetical protein
MKKLLWFFPLVVMGIMDASANSREITKCWFERHGEGNGLSCKAVLIEDDDKVTPPTASTPRERVRLIVDCSCDFRLNDGRATQFEKYRDEYTLGTDDGKLALLIIKNEAQSASNGRQGASLLISDRRSGLLERLEGKCSNRD